MLTMRQKKALIRELRKRYQKARKKEKTVILNEFIKLTGYNRCYACQVLNLKKEKVIIFNSKSDLIVPYERSRNLIQLMKKRKIYPKVYTNKNLGHYLSILKFYFSKKIFKQIK